MQPTNLTGRFLAFKSHHNGRASDNYENCLRLTTRLRGLGILGVNLERSGSIVLDQVIDCFATEGPRRIEVI